MHCLIFSLSSNFESSRLQGKFFSIPGEEVGEGFSRFKTDRCDPAGCLYELCIQLAITMVGKQWFNNFIEIFLP